MIGLVAIVLVVVWILFLSIVLWAKPKIKEDSADIKSSFVSILISLRNEEENIQELCASLNQLTYPNSNYEILLGDDNSEDVTLKLLEKYKPKNAKIYSYSYEDGSFGKQKVLSQLARNAKGDYLLFTDADMQFHSEWIQGMLSRTFDKHEIVVGLTKVSGSGWLDSIQNIDWLFNEWVIGWFARMDIGLTAWGNNLLISKSAYDEIGGHEALEQTVVEDVALLRAASSKGGRLVVNSQVSAVATTKPSSLYALLHQRKRWMKGLIGLNPLVWVGGLVKWLFWPSLTYLTFDNPLWIIIGITAIVLKSQIASQIEKVVNSRISTFHLLLFEIYDFVFYFLTFAFYLLPIKLDWKGRKY